MHMSSCSPKCFNVVCITQGLANSNFKKMIKFFYIKSRYMREVRLTWRYIYMESHRLVTGPLNISSKLFCNQHKGGLITDSSCDMTIFKRGKDLSHIFRDQE